MHRQTDRTTTVTLAAHARRGLTTIEIAQEVSVFMMCGLLLILMIIVKSHICIVICIGTHVHACIV